MNYPCLLSFEDHAQPVLITADSYDDAVRAAEIIVEHDRLWQGATPIVLDAPTN